MALPNIILDDRSYQQLRDELVQRIPIYAPEWTDHNASDPGITLLELFAFLGENLLYRFNQIPEATKLAFLKLLQIPMRPAVPSRAFLTLTTKDPEGALVKLKTHATAGKTSFETETECVAWPLTAFGMGRKHAPDPSTPEATTFVNTILDALREQHPDDADPTTQQILAKYYDAVTLPSDPAAPDAQAFDFGGTVDGIVWIPVLKTDETDPTKLPGKVINIGVITDPTVPEMKDVNACPGAEFVAPAPAVIWQISQPRAPGDTNPRYRELVPVGDGTRGLTQPGIVRLRLPSQASQYGLFVPATPDLDGTGDLPPPIHDDKLRAKVLFWLRAFRLGNTSRPGRILWIGANVTDVQQTNTALPEFLGQGTGQPNQSFRLVNQQVVPNTLVLEIADNDGWTPWTEVDGFNASHESDRHFIVDYEAGVVKFGNGVQGALPQLTQRIRATRYRYGGGRAGNVPAKAINKLELDTGQAVEIANPLPARGGADAETIQDALDRIPAEFRRHDRAVCASDFRELAAATPGADVARAEVLPLFSPAKAASDPTFKAAGVVSVFVWPREDRKNPNAPMPDRTLLQAVCAYLDQRRLVTTELYVLPPVYKKIAVGIGLEAKPGYGIEALRRWVELAVRQFLAPLPPYGPTGSGWPLGRKVRAAEIEAAALQVEGVEFLEGVTLATANRDGTWATVTNGIIELQIYEVVELGALTVVEGTPLPAGTDANPTPPAVPPTPVPTIPEEC
jgi:Baseplate J-like protein